MFCTLLGAPFIHSFLHEAFLFLFHCCFFHGKATAWVFEDFIEQVHDRNGGTVQGCCTQVETVRGAASKEWRWSCHVDLWRATCFFTQRKTNGLHRIPRGGQDRSRLSGVRATADDARHARCKRIVRRLLLRIVRHTNAKARLYSFCWFMEDQMKVKAWVRADDTCLRSLRKQCMLIKRRADFGWATKQTTLTSVRTVGWIGGGEQWSHVEFRAGSEARAYRIARLGFWREQCQAKPLWSSGANDVEFACGGALWPLSRRCLFQANTVDNV